MQKAVAIMEKLFPNGHPNLDWVRKNLEALLALEALAVGTVNAVTRTNNGFELDLGERGGYLFDDIRQIL